MGGTSAGRLTFINGDVLGSTGGLQGEILTVAQLPSHTHTGTAANAGTHTHTYLDSFVNAPAGSIQGGGGVYSNIDTGRTTSGAGDHTHSITISATGSGAEHGNIQPTIVANYIIYAGV
jgi:microcystin-dependent protein